MKKFAAILLIFACSSLNAQKATPQNVKLLADYAKAHHLRWKIICTGDDESPEYLGWAIHENAKFALYVEDGAKDDWTIVGLSQDEAARMLYLEIHDPPKKAEHRPSDKPESRKHCYRDLTSENFTQKCERCGKP